MYIAEEVVLNNYQSKGSHNYQNQILRDKFLKIDHDARKNNEQK